MTNSFDAIVIGGGTNGLGAAAVLGRAGLRVLLVERLEGLGGQRRVEEFAPGFRAAPLAHDDGWLSPAAARALGLTALERGGHDAGVSVTLEGGGFLTLPVDTGRAAGAIRAHSVSDAAKWPAFTARLRTLAGFLETLYQMRAPDIDAMDRTDVVKRLGLARKLRGLGREAMTEVFRTMPMPVAELLDDWFENASVKAAAGAGGVQNLRQGPRSGGTAFVMLHHLTGAPPGSVRGRGWWREGPDAAVRAIEESARRHGVTIRTGAAVDRILVQDDAVAGVKLANGEEIASPRVLSTADPAHTLLDLIDPVWLDPDFVHAVGNIKFRGCAAVLLCALDALPAMPGTASAGATGGATDEHPLAGVVTLTATLDMLERSADAAKYGSVSEQPHIEVWAPSLRWAGFAPAAKHVLAARVQYAPHELKDGAGWTASRRAALADAVIAAIDAVMPGTKNRLLHRVLLAPPDIEKRYGLREGAVTHGELTLDQILFMRPVPGWGHYAMPIDGLYLGGSGAHPGPGILAGPGCLAAGRLLAARGRASR